MTETEADSCIEFFFIAFPQTRKWLSEQQHPNKTYDIWTRVLRGCDYDDVDVVMNEMIDGKLTLPAAYERDQIPQIIRREANARRSRRNEKLRTERKYLNQSKGAWDEVRKTQTGQIAIALGKMTARGDITEAENNRRLDELLNQWDKGKINSPDWIKAMLGGNHERLDSKRGNTSQSDEQQQRSGTLLALDSFDADSNREDAQSTELITRAI